MISTSRLLLRCPSMWWSRDWRSRYLVSMTAKNKLRQTVEELSEAGAQDTLGFIVRRRDKRDALAELLERAPLDDEPTTPEEDEGPAPRKSLPRLIPDSTDARVSVVKDASHAALGREELHELPR